MPRIFVTIETTAFSGATLLTALLCAHPEIATVAEMNGLIESVDPNEYWCSCGQKILECDFWEKVKKGMQARGFEFDVSNFDLQFVSNRASLYGRLRDGSARNKYLDKLRDSILFALPAQARYFQSMSNRNEAFVDTVLEITKKKSFVDSSKDRLRPKALRRFSSLDVRIIHLVRDVRGVIASQMRRDDRITVKQAARAWRRRHRRIEVTLESWPADRCLLLRYEDLCTHTDVALRQIYDFFEVQVDYRLADHQPVSHHLIGNPMRLRQVSKIEIDERWKEELNSDQLIEINSIAGTMANRYGYDLSE